MAEKARNGACQPPVCSQTWFWNFTTVFVFQCDCPPSHWKLCLDSPLNSRNSEDYSPAFSSSDCKEQQHLVSTITTSWTYGDYFTRVVFEKLWVKWKTSRGAALVNGLFQEGTEGSGVWDSAEQGSILMWPILLFLLEYGRSLEDDIRSDTSFMFQRVLVSLSAVSGALCWLLLIGVGLIGMLTLFLFPGYLILSAPQMGTFLGLCGVLSSLL